MEPDDQEVGGPLGGLVDDRGGHVTRLEEDRLERHLVVLGDRLRGVEHALDLLGAARDVGVERERPVDLDDMDGDDLGLCVACLSATSAMIRASVGPPLRATTARWKTGLWASDMASHDTTGTYVVRTRESAARAAWSAARPASVSGRAGTGRRR